MYFSRLRARKLSCFWRKIFGRKVKSAVFCVTRNVFREVKLWFDKSRIFSIFSELGWKFFEIFCKTFQQVCRNCILTVRGTFDKKHIWKNHQAFAIPRLQAEQLRMCQKVPEGLSDQHFACHEEKLSEKAWIQKNWSFSFFLWDSSMNFSGLSRKIGRHGPQIHFPRYTSLEKQNGDSFSQNMEFFSLFCGLSYLSSKCPEENIGKHCLE